MAKPKTYKTLGWYLAHVAVLAGTVYLVTKRLDITAAILLLYPSSGLVLYSLYELVREKRELRAFKKKIASLPRDSFGLLLIAKSKDKRTENKFESTGIGEL